MCVGVGGVGGGGSVTIGHVNCLVCIANNDVGSDVDSDGDSDAQIILVIGRVDKIECTRRRRHAHRRKHTYAGTH